MLRVIEKAAENGDLKKQLHAITGKEKCQMVYRYGQHLKHHCQVSPNDAKGWSQSLTRQNLIAV